MPCACKAAALPFSHLPFSNIPRYGVLMSACYLKVICSKKGLEKTVTVADAES